MSCLDGMHCEARRSDTSKELTSIHEQDAERVDVMGNEKDGSSLQEYVDVDDAVW